MRRVPSCASGGRGSTASSVAPGYAPNPTTVTSSLSLIMCRMMHLLLRHAMNVAIKANNRRRQSHARAGCEAQGGGGEGSLWILQCCKHACIMIIPPTHFMSSPSRSPTHINYKGGSKSWCGQVDNVSLPRN